MNFFRWIKERATKRKQFSDEDIHEMHRVRVCALCLEAAKIWENPVINVDIDMAKVTNFPDFQSGKKSEIVLSYYGAYALDKLEKEIHRRVAELSAKTV